MRRSVVSFVLSSLILASGCACRIAYSPSPLPNREQAVELVERLLREQPAPYSPVSVEVTDEFFSTTQSRSRLLRGGVMIGESVYYDSVADVRLYKRRGWFIVMLLDDAENPLFRYYHQNQKKAEQFFDAIGKLSGRY